MIPVKKLLALFLICGLLSGCGSQPAETTAPTQAQPPSMESAQTPIQGNIVEIRLNGQDITVSGEACPIWVPLVESGEAQSDGADYFVRRHIDNLLTKDDKIDTIILGCTHYPILYDKIRQYTPAHINVITQGEYVGRSLVHYMERHPEMDALCTKQGTCRFLTTESVDIFRGYASIFFDSAIQVQSIALK